MDYEKAYKEALERARALRNEAIEKEYVDDYIKDYETIFPELRESDDFDEEVRKWLVGYFSSIKDTVWIHRNTITCEQILAWLEKQKELMPPVNVDPCDASCDAYYQRGLNKGYELGLEAGMKEQKPVGWKPMPESLEALMYAIEGKWEMIKPTSYLSRRLEDLYEGLVNTFNVNKASMDNKLGSYTLQSSWATSNRQNPVEKQDYSGLTDLERAIHRGFLCAGVENVPVTIIKETAQDCLAQQKAGWSEKEEKILDSLIRLYSKEYSFDAWPWANGAFTYGDVVNFLKSLRPGWKPSEGQMEALRRAVKKLANTDVADSVRLSIMYDNLKKL